MRTLNAIYYAMEDLSHMLIAFIVGLFVSIYDYFHPFDWEATGWTWINDKEQPTHHNYAQLDCWIEHMA